MENRSQRELERAICAVICQGHGLRAREIAAKLGVDHGTVNRTLYRSPLLHELCYTDSDHRWHGIIAQTRPHSGLQEFCAFYEKVRNFRVLSEAAWLSRLEEGCINIGRNLNDARGLYHSFRDCRACVLALFDDLNEMTREEIGDWEIAFEFRLKQARHVRIYADVLVITESRVFSLEFKMKNSIEPDEVQQAAKYTPYLEIVFGPKYEIIPALVLTTAHDLFRFVPIGMSELVLPVCSGDMLFNVFDEYLGFLKT